MSEKTFAQTVREKYGDTTELFAVRLGVIKSTVEKWEDGRTPTMLHKTMLEYADKYDMALVSKAPDEFVALNASGKIEYLMRAYGDHLPSLAQRLRLDYDALYRWKNNNNLTASAERYLCEAATHIDRFARF